MSNYLTWSLPRTRIYRFLARDHHWFGFLPVLACLGEENKENSKRLCVQRSQKRGYDKSSHKKNLISRIVTEKFPSESNKESIHISSCLTAISLDYAEIIGIAGPWYGWWPCWLDEIRKPLQAALAAGWLLRRIQSSCITTLSFDCYIVAQSSSCFLTTMWWCINEGTPHTMKSMYMPSSVHTGPNVLYMSQKVVYESEN